MDFFRVQYIYIGRSAISKCIILASRQNTELEHFNYFSVVCTSHKLIVWNWIPSPGGRKGSGQRTFQSHLTSAIFGFLRRHQHCTGHIARRLVLWGGGNQYIQLGVSRFCTVNCRPQRQATTSFPAWGRAGDWTPASEVGGQSVTTLPPWPLASS